MKYKFTATLPLALLAIGMLGSVTSANADLNNSIYVALDASCRVGDTRGTSTPTIPAGGTVEWHAYGDGADIAAQGGDPGGCPQPKDGMWPTGIAVNITAAANGAATTRNGNLVAYAADATPPTEGSVVNYTPGTNIANSTIVGLCQYGACDGKFIIQSNLSEVRAIADVQGYFYARPSGIAQVAVRGGDYSSPVDAMNDLATWCGTPTVDNTCLIKIAPGTYGIGSDPIVMLPFVSIQGSGFASTQIVGGVGGDDEKTSAIVQGTSGASLSDLSIYNSGGAGGDYSTGIFNDKAAFFIERLDVEVDGGMINTGIFNVGKGSGLIQDTKVRARDGSATFGIYNDVDSDPKITDVTVEVFGATDANVGIVNFNSNTTMSRVSVLASGGEEAGGVVNKETSIVEMVDVSVVAEEGTINNIAVLVDSANVIMTNGAAVANGQGLAISILGQSSKTLIRGARIEGYGVADALSIGADAEDTGIAHSLIEGTVYNGLTGATRKEVCVDNYDIHMRYVNCK